MITRSYRTDFPGIDILCRGIRKEASKIDKELLITQMGQQMHHKMSTYMRNRIIEQAQHVKLKKGTHPIHEGDELTHLYWIEKGIVRGFYINSEGEEVTKCFSSEGGYFGSEGLRGGGQATFHVECLEECSCIAMPYGLVREVIDKDPHIYNYMTSLFMKEVTRLERRTRNLLLLDAKERYQAFLVDYPALEDRVKLCYIASYIGIHPGSLSRIRKVKQSPKE